MSTPRSLVIKVPRFKVPRCKVPLFTEPRFTEPRFKELTFKIFISAWHWRNSGSLFKEFCGLLKRLLIYGTLNGITPDITYIFFRNLDLRNLPSKSLSRLDIEETPEVFLRLLLSFPFFEFLGLRLLINAKSKFKSLATDVLRLTLPIKSLKLGLFYVSLMFFNDFMFTFIRSYDDAVMPVFDILFNPFTKKRFNLK